MANIDFPKDFFWGGAVSAEQTEGKGITKKGATIYEEHFLTRPQDFWGGIGPLQTIEATRKYQSDVALLNQIGLNSHRTSISWARLFPEGDYERPNLEAVKYYHDFIDAFNKKGITLFLTLFHFDLPQYAMELGGFESRQVWKDFLSYSKFVLKEYGSKVKYWTTMNEFWVPVLTGYLHQIQPPFLKNEQRAVNAAYGIVMSHAKVVNYFNQEIKKLYPQNEIGGIFNSAITYPRSNTNKEDLQAAKYLNMFQFTGLTDAAINGIWDPEAVKWIKEMDLIPQNYRPQDLKELSKVNLDFIGLNFYAPVRAQAPIKKIGNNKFENYFSYYEMPSRRENKFRGWEIYPEAVYDTLAFMYNRYQGNKHKYMLTEFGMGIENENIFRNKQGFIDDQYRIAFIKEHLQHLKRFIDDFDAKVMGAHVWATFDCWSWNNAFKNTYGLIEVNLKTLERIPKASAYFMQELIKNKGFDDNFDKVEKYLDYNKLTYSKSVKI